MVALAGHLRLNPHSRVAAIERGHIGWKDWTPEAEIAADRFDQFSAVIAGLGGSAADPSHAYPRPGVDATAAAAEESVGTIADFSVPGFMKFMYG